MNHTLKASGNPTTFVKGLSSGVVLEHEHLCVRSASLRKVCRFLQRDSSVFLEMEKDKLGSKIEVNPWLVWLSWLEPCPVD